MSVCSFFDFDTTSCFNFKDWNFGKKWDFLGKMLWKKFQNQFSKLQIVIEPCNRAHLMRMDLKFFKIYTFIHFWKVFHNIGRLKAAYIFLSVLILFRCPPFFLRSYIYIYIWRQKLTSYWNPRFISPEKSKYIYIYISRVTVSRAPWTLKGKIVIFPYVLYIRV